MTTSPQTIHTLADLLDRLGGVSPDRVRFEPPPGTATEADLLAVEQREGRLCELVDGVLVEKPMGYRESLVASTLNRFLGTFVTARDLGLVSGEAGMMRLFPGLVRIPDVAFAAWDRFPDRRAVDSPIPDLVPSLAVEVLSRGNTEAEMARKLAEYFAAGVQLVWLVDLNTRTVVCYTAPDRSVTLQAEDALDGGAVLPGFSLPLRELFSDVDRAARR